MEINSCAFGRIGLLGNPSDIYGGKGISFTFDRQVNLTLRQSDEIVFRGNGSEERNNLEYNGNHTLLKGCVNYLKLNEKGRGFEIEYDSKIPIGHGFGGSSAILVSALRAFNKYFGLGFNDYDIAEKAMAVENYELGITGGPQDRYAISFEGMVFIDCRGKEFLRENDPYAKVERLEVKELPFFVACSNRPKCSSTVHNDLRERFLNGETWIQKEMLQIGELAELGKKALKNNDLKELGRLMNKNFEMRQKLCNVSPFDKDIVETALANNAFGARQAGSGGGIIVLAEDDNAFNVLKEKYACFKPKIVLGCERRAD